VPITGKVVSPICPKCGRPMVKRRGRYGEFWGCSGFPSCRGIVNVGDEDKHTGAPERLKFKFAPSTYQEQIIKFALEGTGHGVVRANAGCAKTTTNMMVGNQLGHFLGVAFNKHIQTEWAEKQSWADIVTTHSFGYRTIRKAFPNIRIKIDDKKIWNLMKPMVDAQPLEDEDKRALRHIVKKIVDLSRATLSTDFAWLCDRYGIDTNGDAELAYMISKYVLEQDKQMVAVIDFGDMLWLPHVLDLEPPKYPFILADEAQDFNQAQTELILRALEPGGRIIAVGDENQSLYGFRGADVDSIPNMIERLDATTMPLPICYRCGKEIVKLAQTFVPEIQAAPNAIDGEVVYQTEEQALREVQEGDMILCRTNAPLVRPIYQLIRQGVKATIRGRDIGKGLVVFIEKFEPKSISLSDCLSKMSQYGDREVAKLVAAEKNSQAQTMADKVETIWALSEGVETVEELKSKTESIFSDGRSEVVGSTVHRAKGLEADNVVILHPELMPHPMAKKAWEIQQEMNCIYVAITRAKKRLVYAAAGG